jgi:hypothetical protein
MGLLWSRRFSIPRRSRRLAIVDAEVPQHIDEQGIELSLLLRTGSFQRHRVDSTLLSVTRLVGTPLL